MRNATSPTRVRVGTFHIPNLVSAGFTLVEVMIVIALMAVIPGIIIANFPQIRSQFSLSRSAYRFAQEVRRAEDRAISSIEYKDASGATRAVDGYGVYVDASVPGSTQYLMYADKDPGNQYYDAQDYVVETIDLNALEPGVVIKQLNNVFGSRVSINFSPPNPDTTITQLLSGQNSVDVVFALKADPSQTRTVTVSTSGLVEVR